MQIQALGNYGSKVTCDPLSFVVRPTKLQPALLNLINVGVLMCFHIFCHSSDDDLFKIAVTIILLLIFRV